MAPSLGPLEHERHVVEVAVGPVLTGLDRADDRMSAQARVCRGVPVRRGVTASHVTAAATDPQMHPRRSDRQTVLAPDHLLRSLDEDLLEMRANDHHASWVGVL